MICTLEERPTKETAKDDLLRQNMNKFNKYILFVDLLPNNDIEVNYGYNGQACFVACVCTCGRTISEADNINASWTWVSNNHEWNSLLACNPTSSERSCDDSLVADHLHNLANKLPHAGYQVQVIWKLHKDRKLTLCSNLLMFGALKRLQCWHNAQIVCILPKDDDMSLVQSWIDYLDIEVSNNVEDILQRRSVWHGQMSLTDRKNLINCVLPGFSLVDLGTTTEDYDNDDNLLIHKRQYMSVVQVINKDDVPLAYITPQHYKLSVMANSCWVDVSRCFLESITEDENIAMIVTLECQKLSKAMLSPPECRSTIKWKRQISANPMDFKVPEVDLRGSWFSINVLLCNDGDDGCNAFVLLSPSDFNGHVMVDLANLANKYQSEVNEDEQAIEKIAELDAEKVVNSQDNIPKIQIDILQRWSEDQKNQNQQPTITDEDMKWFLNSVRTQYFNRAIVQEIQSTSNTVNQDEEVTTELDLSPSCWVERQALQSKESYIRKMKRFKSSDRSLAGISAPPVDSKITLDAKEFIKHFGRDGTALAEELSPIAVVNGSGRCTSISMSGTQGLEDVSNAPFNEALKYNYYGINYCLDSRNAVYYDEKYQKLECRIICNETASTCTIEQVDSPATMAINPVRRSPRKRLARTPVSKSKSHRKYQSPRSAKRRANMKLETSCKRPSRSPRVSKACKGPSLAGNTSVTKSEEVIAPSQAVATVPKKSQQSEKTAQVKKGQSRSERHKRKLKYIVDNTLKSKGIAKNDVCYPGCAQRLFSLTKSFVQDLKSSKGLDQQMRNIAESNVDQVISFEKMKKT
ncbi:mdm2-binding protein-like [Antedon mediterranea]|uniref:mdm2-binding protein-like n=1 Tax=Antedon mediterranea TaxID=105859 RepID=UPI003AF7F864